jgi:hypothetical protein
VTREHEADLIVIDTASSVVGADPNSNQDVCALYRNALRPATERGATVLLLCHERKPSPDGHRGSGSLATMGARAWAHQADSHITMRATGPLVETLLEDGRTTQRFPIELEFPKTRDGVAQVQTTRWVIVSERIGTQRATVSFGSASSRMTRLTRMRLPAWRRKPSGMTVCSRRSRITASRWARARSRRRSA